jgi:glycosyltransferase involved in cell wall biosynthesis
VPKVTILTPTYNRASLLRRSINSVLAQSWSDWEYIIIDDGSTDNTQEVLASYKDPRIRSVRFEQNRGIGTARKTGVNEASGEWISFLDADDLWRPGKLTQDLAILERHPKIDLLFDNFQNINYVEGVRQSGFEQANNAIKMLKTTQVEEDVFRIDSGFAKALLSGNLIGTASVMTVHRTLFEKIGNFNSALSGPEDFELLWRAALEGIGVAYHDKVLVERYKDVESITADRMYFNSHLLHAYDICEISLWRYGHDELIAPLNLARGRAWQGLLHASALEGQRLKAISAFGNSLRYGVSIQPFLYLAAALAGPRAIRFVKRMIS